ATRWQFVSLQCNAWRALCPARMCAELSDDFARYGDPARRLATRSKIVTDFCLGADTPDLACRPPMSVDLLRAPVARRVYSPVLRRHHVVIADDVVNFHAVDLMKQVRRCSEKNRWSPRNQFAIAPELTGFVLRSVHGKPDNARGSFPN